MKKKKEFVYLVGDNGPEHDSIANVHKTYNGALKSWNELRIALLNQAKYMLKYTKDDAKKQLEKGVRVNGEKLSKESIKYFKDIAKNGQEMYLEIIKKLSEEDPKEIDNYPHETPYIYKIEVEP